MSTDLICHPTELGQRDPLSLLVARSDLDDGAIAPTLKNLGIGIDAQSLRLKGAGGRNITRLAIAQRDTRALR
jgi:hypothetical protein